MCESCGCHTRYSGEPHGHHSTTRHSTTLQPSTYQSSSTPPSAGLLYNKQFPVETLRGDAQFTFVRSQQNTIVESNDSDQSLLQPLLDENNQQAELNRSRFNNAQVFTVNLMSSPGAGKTSLLEATIQRLKSRYRIAVIEGDLETENDALRIRRHGVPAVQITTGSACHLDAHYIDQALADLDLTAIDILFIENVGNLVCPAAFDLGQHKNIVLLSVTEGDDKPLKYPVMFQKVDGMVITKTELLNYFDDFNIDSACQYFHRLANHNPIWTVSAKSGDSMDSWCDWLNQNFQKRYRERDLTREPVQ